MVRLLIILAIVVFVVLVSWAGHRLAKGIGAELPDIPEENNIGE